PRSTLFPYTTLFRSQGYGELSIGSKMSTTRADLYPSVGFIVASSVNTGRLGQVDEGERVRRDPERRRDCSFGICRTRAPRPCRFVSRDGVTVPLYSRRESVSGIRVRGRIEPSASRALGPPHGKDDHRPPTPR